MQRTHLAIILIFVGFGAIVGTHTGAIPTLVSRSGMSPSAFGIAGSLGMLINIGCMAAGGYINRFASPRTNQLAGDRLAIGYSLVGQDAS